MSGSSNVSVWRRVWYATITAMIIQNVWIAGGYATGREVVEFMAKYGVLAPIAIIVSAITLIIAVYLTLEVARVFKAFDYMTWSKQFLGRFWVAFDAMFIVMSWIVLAVVIAASNYMISDLTGLPPYIATIVITIVIALLHFFGRKAIEASWVVGSIGLISAYIIAWSYILSAKLGESLAKISAGLSMGSATLAAIDGFRYMLYNLYSLPPTLQSADRYRGRLESLVASIMSAVLVYGTVAVIWLCLMAYYPDVIYMTAPVYDILKSLGAYWVLGYFVFWVFYTLMATALGMIYAIILRVEAQLKQMGRRFTRVHEAILAAVILAIAALTSQAGLATLIAQGYGTMAWVFFAVYFIPLATVGVYRLSKAGKK